jgi:FeS assembly SUF system protein
MTNMAIAKDDGLTLADFTPGVKREGAGEDGVIRAGAPLGAGMAVASPEAVIAALRQVQDPEIPVNIYDLGLIYDVAIAADGTVGIVMTLTAPACPVAGELPGQVARQAAGVPGVGRVEVRLVWEPAWTKDRMSDEARVALDLF